MKLAVSNIAWNADQDDAIGKLLIRHGIAAVEVAPTKYFAAPCSPTKNDIAAVRAAWSRRGLSIIACQSLLFQMPQLNLLGEEPIQRATIDYLGEIMHIGAQLGARRFVFGSPKNRDRMGLDGCIANQRAISALRQLAQRAAALDVVFCIEPNPAQYQCNYLTTAAEALAIVQEINHPGLGLHLDTGIMLLNDEDPTTTIEACFAWLRHVHISAPNLLPVGQSRVEQSRVEQSSHEQARVDHAAVASVLKRWDYQGYVSVEMRGAATLEESYSNVEQACHVLHEHYGNELLAAKCLLAPGYAGG